MTESISELLGRHRRPEPPEIKLIKDFVRKRYNKPITVSFSKENIVLETNNGALAGELRMQTYSLQKTLGITKKIIIRIV